MEAAVAQKLLAVLPTLGGEQARELASKFVQDGLQKIDQLQFLTADQLSSRYGLNFFSAAELAAKLKLIGGLTSPPPLPFSHNPDNCSKCNVTRVDQHFFT